MFTGTDAAGNVGDSTVFLSTRVNGGMTLTIAFKLNRLKKALPHLAFRKTLEREKK